MVRLLTQDQLLKRLHMSRQNFWKAGLDTLIQHTLIGRSKLYNEQDVLLVVQLLERRSQLIAEGVWGAKHPVADSGLWQAVLTDTVEDFMNHQRERR